MRALPLLSPALLSGSMLAGFVLTAPLSAAQAQTHIVSVGGALTEIIYDLHQEDRLVGIDSTSNYPDAVKRLPDIGYMRRLAAEPILALNPDLLLIEEGSGPPAVLTQLHATGVTMIMIPDTPGLPGVVDKIHKVSAALGQTAAGDALAAQVESAGQILAARLAHVQNRPKVLVLMSGGKGNVLAAGDGTAAQAIIDLAGGQNAVAGFSGYKPLTPEIVAASAPDVILIPDFALAGLGGEKAVLDLPDLAGSPAAQNKRVVVMEGMLLLGFGPRTPLAATDLAAALHPELHLTP
ncbi:ABC transporter substrate-binding protein [Acidisoma cellulosilytica]|uniref:ABC transporter substrate-binding protein n=1 Tax=Acidisoma cellulosilyticum TaxID=2802395 RepID=A0A964E3Q9_9PROT|nr:ABC transporter substrate-binding protein [Acidisoma cellulosilyticum]MCB8880487.1 ABC transporter substrate-binding protein [Acidisoma cellulosilyticum]